MYVYTKTTDSEDYGELTDSFKTITQIQTKIDDKTYTISLNTKRQNRIELTVE